MLESFRNIRPGWPHPLAYLRSSHSSPHSVSSSPTGLATIFDSSAPALPLLASPVLSYCAIVHLGQQPFHIKSSSSGYKGMLPYLSLVFPAIYISLFAIHHLENYILRSRRCPCSTRQHYLHLLKHFGIPLPRGVSGLPTATVTETYFTNRRSDHIYSSDSRPVGQLKPGLANIFLSQFMHFDPVHLFANTSAFLSLTRQTPILDCLGTTNFLLIFLGSGLLTSYLTRSITQHTNPYLTLATANPNRLSSIEHQVRADQSQSLHSLVQHAKTLHVRKLLSSNRTYIRLGIELSRISETRPNIGASAALNCLSTLTALSFPTARTTPLALISTALSAFSSNQLVPLIVSRLGSRVLSSPRQTRIPITYSAVFGFVCDAACWLAGINPTIGHQAHMLGSLSGLIFWFGGLRWVVAARQERLIRQALSVLREKYTLFQL